MARKTMTLVIKKERNRYKVTEGKDYLIDFAETKEEAHRIAKAYAKTEAEGLTVSIVYA